MFALAVSVALQNNQHHAKKIKNKKYQHKYESEEIVLQKNQFEVIANLKRWPPDAMSVAHSIGSRRACNNWNTSRTAWLITCPVNPHKIYNSE
jgi:hypothetical protein